MSPKIKIVGLGLGGVFKNPEIIEMRSLGLSHKQIEILLYQIEAEKSTKLLNLLFKYVCHENGPTITKHFPNYFLMFLL